MIFLPDTNACIALLRRRNDHLIERWKSIKATDIVLCQSLFMSSVTALSEARIQRENTQVKSVSESVQLTSF